MKRLIIADLKSNNNYGICTGHYYALAANYQKVFYSNFEVKIASGPIYLAHFKPEEMLMLPCDYIVGDSKLMNILRMLRNGHSLYKQTKRDDIIIVQQSQPAMIMITLILTFFFRPKSIIQIQYTEEPMHRKYFRILARLGRRVIKAIICPNESVGKAYGVPYHVASDYIYTPCENNDEVSYTNKSYDCCIVGRIAKEKGVADAVSALAGKKVSILVAGAPQDKDEESLIRSIGKNYANITLRLEYLSEKDYLHCIRKSRYAILNYGEAYAERSSGVVLDTIFNGLPIIGHRCKALQFIEDNNLGVLYNTIEEVDFETLLKEDKYNEFRSSILQYKNILLKEAQQFKDFISE